MSEKPVVGVAGTTAADARKLINMGWEVDDFGRWSKSGVTDEPLPPAEALRIAVAVARASSAGESPQPVQKGFWDHFARTPGGTTLLGGVAAVVTYAVLNPPTFLDVDPATLKWVLGAIAVAVGINPTMKSLRARNGK